MGRPSVMQHRFSEVPTAEIPRSSFDRSHGYKTTFDSGLLIPIFVDEALPGDTFNLRMTSLARLATPLHPFMDNLRLSTFFFAVPLRLVWENWERMNGQQDDPEDSTDFLCPQVAVTGGGYAELSIYDYMGIPTKVADLGPPTAFHLRAYNLIWNEWFRDQNLQDRVTVLKDDGPDPANTYELLRRGKRHDYFTSALPWPQKGPSIGLPLGESAPVATDSVNTEGVSVFSTLIPGQRRLVRDGSDNVVLSGSDGGNPLFADLSEATAATINQLRQAFQIQKIFERDARGGTRYTEMIRSHFGVTSPDARLQRPEYLGGGVTDINVTPVPQMSATDVAVSPQGNLAGFGVASASGHGFSTSFTEHCVVLGLACVTADLTYQQGLPRMWSRRTRFDFYLPALAQIGEQAVLNKEIFAQGTSADEDVFGYQERYAEYRYKPSQITGRFRSNATTPLDTWHLSQDFANLPELGAEFIEEHPPVERVIAVPSEPELLFDAYFQFRCARPMPIYGVPGNIDRF